MKKSMLFSLLLIGLIVIAASCKKDNPEPDPTTPDTPYTSSVFKFFKTNATWTYDTYDSDGPTVLTEVFNIASINASGYGTVTWTIQGMTCPTMEWYADNAKFSKLCSQVQGKMLTYCTAAPAVGDSWSETWDNGSGGTITDSCRIVSVNETVVVPAGTFTNCIKIIEKTSDDLIYYKYYWLSLDYGIIKTEGTDEEDAPTIIYSDLRSYSIPN